MAIPYPQLHFQGKRVLCIEKPQTTLSKNPPAEQFSYTVMSISAKTASAAVAIIRSFTPRESFLVLRRVVHPEDPWSGHFSFPGGRREEADQDLLATCIRETREETGIILDAQQLQQRLPLERAGHRLQNPLWVEPFLFTIRNLPELTLCSREIQSACWLNARQFQDIDLHQNVEMLPGEIFPAFPLEDYYLWGFTYRLLLTIFQMDGRQKYSATPP